MMDCQQLLQITGWDCRPAGRRAVRAISPLTLGNDGQHAAFYLAQPDDTSFFITDAGETAMHAAAHGIDLNSARINTLNSSNGILAAKFSSSGEITASGPIGEVQDALWDAVKLALSLTFNSSKWAPKLDQVRFRALVEKILIDTAGPERLLRNYRVQGISGHNAEFPFALKAANDQLYLIEPIALIYEKIDWSHIYQVHGKLSDVKQANEVAQRIVIFQEGAAAVEFGRAATLLAQSASIKTLSEARSWARTA